MRPISEILAVFLVIALLAGPTPARAEEAPTTQEVLQRLDEVYAAYVNCMARMAVLALEVEDEEARGRILKSLVDGCKEDRRSGVRSAGIIPVLVPVIRGDMDKTLWPEEQWARSKSEIANREARERKPFKPIVERYLRCLGHAVVAADYSVLIEAAGARFLSLKDQCRRERLDAVKQVVLAGPTHTDDGRKLSPLEILKLAAYFDAMLDSGLVAHDPALQAIVDDFAQKIMERSNY